jgi:hypothetical protein
MADARRQGSFNEMRPAPRGSYSREGHAAAPGTAHASAGPQPGTFHESNSRPAGAATDEPTLRSHQEVLSDLDKAAHEVRKQFPNLTFEQAYSRAMADPANRGLVIEETRARHAGLARAAGG